jgi:hypothetical protein
LYLGADGGSRWNGQIAKIRLSRGEIYTPERLPRLGYGVSDQTIFFIDGNFGRNTLLDQSPNQIVVSWEDGAVGAGPGMAGGHTCR